MPKSVGRTVRQDTPRQSLITRLQEAEQTLKAIQSGAVDAVLVMGPNGPRVYTLQGADKVYRILFETMREGAVTIDSSGVILFSNAFFADLCRVPLSRVVSSSFYHFIRPEDVPQVQRLLRRGLKGYSSGEVTLVAQDGTGIPVLLSVSPLVTDSLRALSVVVTDLTERSERERAERSLRETSALMETVVERAPVIFWATDREGVLTLLQGQALQALGITPEQAIGRSFMELVSIMPEVATGFDRALQGQATIDDQNFRGRVYQSHYLPLVDEEGRIQGVMGLSIDITERKQAEEELARSLSQLRALSLRLVAVREEERTSIAREIHDDLGQELTAVKMELMMLAQDLEKIGVPEEIQNHLQALIDTSDTAVAAVQDLSMRLRPHVLDELGLEAALESEMQRFARRTNLRCHYDLRANHLTLDPDRSTALFRIFQESLTNIARHSNASEVDVVLDCADGNLVLTVADNGRGIDAEQITDSKSLGLLGMRERLGAFGGQVEFEGEPGRGTRVIATMPVD